jgi:hypothetical protein
VRLRGALFGVTQLYRITWHILEEQVARGTGLLRAGSPKAIMEMEKAHIERLK